MPLVVYTFQSDVEKVQKLGFQTTTRVGLSAVEHARDVVLRWGKSVPARDGANRETDFLHTLNPAFAIRRNVNKPKALARLAEVVKTPRMWVKRMPIKKLAVIRPLSHSAGSSFKVVQGPCRIPRGHYATEYYSTDYEARCWFVRTGPNKGYTMSARRVPMQKNVVGVHPCRSEWGYQWHDKVPKDLHELTLKAATKACLDVGAVDCLRVKGEWVCLEVNTAVAVDARSIREFYSLYIPQAARAKYPYLSWSAAPGSVPPVLGSAPYRPSWSSSPAYTPPPAARAAGGSVSTKASSGTATSTTKRPAPMRPGKVI